MRPRFAAPETLLALLLGPLGCAHPPAPEAHSPSGPQAASAACGSQAAATPAHCECLGGYVKGDIGDGQVACPQGETELERVRQGIEGAVCCKRMVE